MDMKITTEDQNSGTIVHISGKIDALTSDELEGTLKRLCDQGTEKLVVDLENVQYISSAGLRVLIVISKMMSGKGFFCICSANESVLKIIKMAGFDAFMNIFDNIETAKANLDKS